MKIKSKNSVDYLLQAKSISLSDAWVISNGILDWLVKRHLSGHMPNRFSASLFEYFPETKELIPPDESWNQPDSNGHPEYLSPEETGRLAETPDFRADFYRLGVVWYEIFSGRPPFFHHDRMKVIWQHLADSPPPLLVPGLPASAIQIIEKLLAKRPDQRYFSVQGLRQDWEQAYFHFRNPEEFRLPFIPGTFDFPEEFSLPAVFPFRENGLKQAIQIANQVGEKGAKALIWIKGAHLSGKSVWIDDCISRLYKEGFSVLRCACLQTETLPYQPIKTALDNFARVLQFHQIGYLSNLKTRLSDALGGNLSVLTSFAPQWEEVVGAQPTAGLLSGPETQERLSFVIAKTLSLIALPGHPIAFFIDDIHLMAQQTIRLLNAIFAEPDIRNCVLFAAQLHPERNDYSTGVRQELPDESIFSWVETIQLDPLEQDEISAMLELARVDPLQIGELAVLLERKSGGNPYAIRQLLSQAVAGGFFKPGSQQKWLQVDLNAVSTLTVSDDIYEYQAEKINNLSGDALEWLQIAASEGVYFEMETIRALLPDMSEADFVAISEQLQRNEIIVPNLLDAGFRFAGPVLQATVKNTISPARQAEIFEQLIALKISDGKFLQSDNHLFKILGFVLQITNRGVARYQHLLKDGAERAKRLGAFDEAAKYYWAILEAVKPADEQERFEINANLLETLIGDLQFDEYYSHLENIRRQFNLDELRQCRLDLIECRALLIQQKMPEVVMFARQSLLRMGISITLQPSLPRIILSMIKSQRGMKGRSVAELEKLPLASDPRTRYILQLLQDTSSAFFLAAPRALPEVLALQINLAIKKGISETMGVVFAAYGFNLSAFGGQFDKAEEMMTLARNLDQRFGNIKGAVVVRFLHAALTRHWHFALRENAALLRENYHLGRERGLLQMAFFSLATGNLFELFSGMPLSKMLPQLEEDIKACADKKQHSMVSFLSMALQFCADLRGIDKPSVLMEGRYFSASSERPIFIKENLQTNQAILYGLESTLNLVWQQNEGAAQRLPGMLKLLSAVGLSSVSLLFAIIQTTISAFKSEETSDRFMRSARKKIKYWAGKSPVNFKGWYHLLEGVISLRSNKIQDALFHIEQSVAWAGKQNLIYLEALALEEKAGLQMQWDYTGVVPMAIADAHSCYYRWGAYAKCADLEKKYPGIRSASLHKGTSVSEADLTSLLRASNSIASEIRWEHLLEKLSTILVENAGAQNAVILIPHPDGLKEVARKTGQLPVFFQEVNVMPSTHPVSILRSVQRMRVPELVNNPVSDPRWSMDPYIINSRPLSVLCIPVIKNQDLSAIIYLENNLTAGAFTQEGVELLRLLSGQIAISIENSQLYVDMEKRVADRTRQLHEKNQEMELQRNKLLETLNELKSTQAQLIQSEKMASLGELTAGIAHEIQNPLNFVNNFSEVSKELIGELSDEVDKGNYSEVKSIAQDLVQNLEKINHHGKRADAIVKGMLAHSRTSSGQKEPTDLNALCDEYLRLAYHARLNDYFGQGLKAKNKPFNADFKTDLDTSIGLIPVVQQDIGRVLLNLINNAFYAVAEKSKLADSSYQAAVTVSTKRKDKAIEISVRDNGIGIPDLIKEKIYQPFFTTKPAGQGTGLGLSISYDIVKAHGGVLSVESEPGKGTVFSILIPQSWQG